jgi:hypothetical protein
MINPKKKADRDLMKFRAGYFIKKYMVNPELRHL